MSQPDRLLDSFHADNPLTRWDGHLARWVHSGRCGSDASLWDLASRHPSRRWTPVARRCWASRSRTMAPGSPRGVADNTVRIWELRSRRLVREFSGHLERVQSVAFSVDDRTLISAGDDATIRVWDVATGHLRGVHLGHGNWVWGVAVAPGGQTIVSASRDGSVKLWDCRPPEVLTRLVVKEPLKALAFSADSQVLIAAGTGGLISRWHADRRTPRDLVASEFTFGSRRHPGSAQYHGGSA